MSTIIETKKRTAQAKPKTRRAAQPQPVATDETVELLDKRPGSEITRLVFMALLGCAACIALVGVVGEMGEPGVSPDDPAPVVIVN